MGFVKSHNRGTIITRLPRKNYGCLAKPITDVLPANSWAGKKCFIVGGGPSLKHFDFSLLKGFHVITINKAFQYFPSKVNYGMDYTFFDFLQYNSSKDPSDRKLQKAWRKYKGIKLFSRHDSTLRFCEGVYYVDELTQKQICFDLNQGIYCGNNSGVGALMLSVALGCKKIGLLGYDFKVIGKQTHFHDGYKGQNLKTFVPNLEAFRKNLDELAETLKDLKISIVNLSSNSALQSYPKSSFKAFLKL